MKYSSRFKRILDISMTREEAKELMPIIQAFAEGKTIQAKLITNGKWVDLDDEEELTFSCPPSDYRIKPEPKYRPFRTQEECWNEMHKHPDFGWLKSKATGRFDSIGSVSEQNDKKPTIIWATNEGYNFLASDVFDDYTFTDDTPFGIKEE